MRYSEDLLGRFQQKYKSKFKEKIDIEKAELELNRLARAIERVIPADSIPNGEWKHP